MFYYMSILSFSHIHYVDGVMVIHSHPLNEKNHSHTQQEYIALSYLSTAQVLETDDFRTEIIFNRFFLYAIDRFSPCLSLKEISLQTLCLRGPPALVSPFLS